MKRRKGKKRAAKKDTKLQELERRVKALEERCVIVIHHTKIQPIPFDEQEWERWSKQTSLPKAHYHNGYPCYNDPCVWCESSSLSS